MRSLSIRKVQSSDRLNELNRLNRLPIFIKKNYSCSSNISVAHFFLFLMGCGATKETIWVVPLKPVADTDASDTV